MRQLRIEDGLIHLRICSCCTRRFPLNESDHHCRGSPSRPADRPWMHALCHRLNFHIRDRPVTFHFDIPKPCSLLTPGCQPYQSPFTFTCQYIINPRLSIPPSSFFPPCAEGLCERVSHGSHNRILVISLTCKYRSPRRFRRSPYYLCHRRSLQSRSDDRLDYRERRRRAARTTAISMDRRN